MPLSADAQALAIAGVLYLAAFAIWALSIEARGRILLRTLAERADPELWQSVGAPASPLAALMDPERRWRRFVERGEHRRRLDAESAELIDAWRRRTRNMLLVFAAGALLLLVRFWPLLAASPA